VPPGRTPGRCAAQCRQSARLLSRRTPGRCGGRCQGVLGRDGVAGGARGCWVGTMWRPVPGGTGSGRCAPIAGNGRPLRMSTVIDEYTLECLAIRVGRRLTAEYVQECLTELFCARGVPEHIRSDNGPRFTSCRIRRWLSELGTRTLFIEPRSPWENGHTESFNGKQRHELLNREIFDTLQETEVLIEPWRQQYNRRRPHSSLGNRPPEPEVCRTPFLGSPLAAAAAFVLPWTLAQKPGAAYWRANRTPRMHCSRCSCRPVAHCTPAGPQRRPSVPGSIASQSTTASIVARFLFPRHGAGSPSRLDDGRGCSRSNPVPPRCGETGSHTAAHTIPSAPGVLRGCPARRSAPDPSPGSSRQPGWCSGGGQ